MKKIILSVLLSGLLIGGLASSAKAASINSWELPAYKGLARSQQVLKQTNNSTTQVSLGYIDGYGTGSYAVDATVVNSNDQMRAECKTVGEYNTRELQNYSSMQRNFYYRLRVCNHSYVGSSVKIVTGTWNLR